MKNYPGLYNNHINKKNSIKITKSPIKNNQSQHILNTKTSTKTINIYNNHMSNNHERHNLRKQLSKSIQDLRYNYRSQIYETQDNMRMNNRSILNQDQQLFARSYSKIGKIKQSFPYKSIDVQLNQILNLIKQQKNKINIKMRTLKNTNQEYKKLCEGHFKNRVDIAINTDEILDSMNEKVVHDKMVECNLMDQIKNERNQLNQSDTAIQSSSHSVTNKQAYLKLSKMLQQMNINAQDILPSQQKIHEQIYINDYKTLGDKQIIKIQKFFIKKLIQKMPK